MTDSQDVVTGFLAAWATRNSARRLEELAAVCAEDVVYIDPLTHAEGRAALSAHISTVAVQFPDHRIVLTSGVDAHHDVARFGWTAYDPAGQAALVGIDTVTFASDGRLLEVIAFFGPLPPRTYTFGSPGARGT